MEMLYNPKVSGYLDKKQPSLRPEKVDWFR